MKLSVSDRGYGPKMTATGPMPSPAPPSTTWRDLLLDQLSFYWDFHLWPRLDGLADVEYLWEPASPAWSVRRGPDGVPRLEQEVPEPEIPPVTTIAWRMVHVGRDVFGRRARAHADMFDPRHWPDAPITAEGGLAMLEEGYRSWRAGIERLDDESLLRPIGPKGAGFAEFPMAALVTHLSREAMAHGGEICLLRDLYRAQASPSG